MNRVARRAVVTGAASGIGRAVTLRLAREGANVLALDVDPVGLGSLSGDPRPRFEAGPAGRIRTVTCDCSDDVALAAAAEEERLAEGIDVLVNNAGINPDPAPITATPPTQWDRILRANLRSVYAVSRAVLPHMRAGGAVVNVASILALAGARSCAAYSASKAAIVGLTRAMARDHAPRIRVNCVCPGAIDTPMLAGYAARLADPEAELRRIERGIPLGRLGTPEDVAGAVLFLASDEAAWITGAVLVVDGGDSA